MDRNGIINEAMKKFGAILEEQLKRVDEINAQGDFVDYIGLDKIVIGVAGGDGIGPIITEQAIKALKLLLDNEITNEKVEIREINGLTIENRIAANKAIPDDVADELKKCHVILKGPTTTPQAGDGRPNIESANVYMRKLLDLFANVRPVHVPEKSIDWTFFRENTEGAYAVGSKGFEVTSDLAVDFTITTEEGSRRIIRAAFDFADKNNKKTVTAVTKANVIKTTDGKFLSIAKEIAKEYPHITLNERYADILAAIMIDEVRRTEFSVFVLPNLYGDILTDEAAELQGGVGTAGGANIGKKYAMFEAIHGSAPRMVDEKRAQYANPTSIMRAAAMLLTHIGYVEKASVLNRALDECAAEQRVVVTSRSNGATCADYAEYVFSKMKF